MARKGRGTMKSKFLSKLDVELISDTADKWRLKAPLVYYSAFLKQTVTVPEGYITDFASVPRLPLAYALAGNTARLAAVVHDYLYECGDVDRGDADEVFLEAMKVTGLSWWRRYPMHFAVELFGWKFKKEQRRLNA